MSSASKVFCLKPSNLMVSNPSRATVSSCSRSYLILVMNGIKAMSAVMDRPRILRVISQLQQPGEVLIAVTDVGAGLDPANMNRIYEPFFTTKPQGMGMGLAICRSIIEAHGGELWASPPQAARSRQKPPSPERPVNVTFGPETARPLSE